MTTAVIAAGLAGTSFLCLAAAGATRDRASVSAGLAPVDAGAVSAARSPHVGAITGACAVVGAAVGYMIAGVAGAVAAALACLVLPPIRTRKRRNAEAAALQDGLADAVGVMAAAIRAGRSMAGALEEAATTLGPPLGPRLAALVDRVTLGVPVDRAVLELTAAVPGPDGRLVAAVLGLHQRSGGDAPAVLDRVARTLRDRRASAREIRSLTAQARLSAAILGFLPIGFFLFLSVTARADVERALASSTGLTAVAIGLAMQAAAFVWIGRLLRVQS